MTDRITIDRRVPVRMRDGTVLRAEVVRPVTGARVPALLLRSPYAEAVARNALDAVRAAEAGFAVVAQHVRGTGASDGEFVPWVHEPDDGADTIAWCAAQPWCTGEVGTIGPSYLAHTQLFAAQRSPAALRAMVAVVAPADPYDLTYVGGALALGSALYWALGRTGDELARQAAAGADVAADVAEWAALMKDVTAVCATTPLRDVPLLDRWFPSWRRWLDHPRRDAWWDAVAVPGPWPVPVMFVGGWYDLFLRGTLTGHARARGRSRLVIGPWAHSAFGQTLGDVDHGFAASAAVADLQGEQLDFLAEHLLPGHPTRAAAPVRIFVMGIGAWRDEQEWPLARARDTRYHLRAGGLLAPEPPVEGGPATTAFGHDPRDPRPTIGGATLMPGNAQSYRVGGVDQRELDGRADVARFTTPALPADLEVTGELRAHLHVSTSAADTDWTVTLVDVWPSGEAITIADGIIRARYRDGGDQLVEPHTVYPVVVDLVATSMVFRAGHRIRVDVSSSNFPRFDRNPGTAAPAAATAEAEFRPSTQSVHHDPTHLSWITLPVVDA